MDITYLLLKLTKFIVQYFKLRNPCCRQSRRFDVHISNSSFNTITNVFITRVVSYKAIFNDIVLAFFSVDRDNIGNLPFLW